MVVNPLAETDNFFIILLHPPSTEYKKHCIPVAKLRNQKISNYTVLRYNVYRAHCDQAGLTGLTYFMPVAHRLILIYTSQILVRNQYPLPTILQNYKNLEVIE